MQAPAISSNGRAGDVLHTVEITRIEVLADMRPAEEDATRALLSTLVWHPVDAGIAEEAGALGRQWLLSHHAIDSPTSPSQPPPSSPTRDS